MLHTVQKIALEWRVQWSEALYHHFSFGRGGITIKDVRGCQLCCVADTQRI